MQSTKLIQITAKVGIFVLMLGLGLALSGLIGYFIEQEAANKATMIGGMVMAAVGFVMTAMENLLMEDF